jgi:hypothetical protein
MSNPLALAAVTAVLQYYLSEACNGVTSPLGSVLVSAKAPDIVQQGLAASNAPLQVNLFLHQVTYNQGWRNAGQPVLAADGQTRRSAPPLALDLHYLMTAYASEDTQAEALLGYTILQLHQFPVLARADITNALEAIPAATNPLAGSMATTGIADQIEMLKITPATLGREEMAWLWTALKADYRPSFPFQVSVVLIEPAVPYAQALPVLSRSLTVQAGAVAQLLTVQPPSSQTAAGPGDVLTLTGQALAVAPAGGTTTVMLANPRLGVQYPTVLPAGSVTATQAPFTVPDDPANLPAGMYNLWLRYADATGAVIGATNVLPVPVAPKLTQPFPAGAAVANAAGTLVTVGFKPQAWPRQTVSLAVAGMAVAAPDFTANAASFSFQFPALPAGTYVVRLTIDGVDSPITINLPPPPPAPPTPPSFGGPMLTI